MHSRLYNQEDVLVYAVDVCDHGRVTCMHVHACMSICTCSAQCSWGWLPARPPVSPAIGLIIADRVWAPITSVPPTLTVAPSPIPAAPLIHPSSTCCILIPLPERTHAERKEGDYCKDDRRGRNRALTWKKGTIHTVSDCTAVEMHTATNWV